MIEKFHKNPHFLCVFDKWCYNNPFHHLSVLFYLPNIACHEISRHRSQSQNRPCRPARAVVVRLGFATGDY
ncbi:hypothetical protein [Moraxella lacunata]|uniref:hypothetical protein n=1 Tax=Moraxella lacunata TaxID=477 RepID=UPI003EE3C94B